MPSDEDITEIKVTLARIDANLKRFMQDLEDHETRLRSLDKWRWGMPSTLGVALIALIGTAIEVFS